MICGWRQGSWLLISDFLGDLWLEFFFSLPRVFLWWLCFGEPVDGRVGECRSFSSVVLAGLSVQQR